MTASGLAIFFYVTLFIVWSGMFVIVLIQARNHKASAEELRRRLRALREAYDKEVVKNHRRQRGILI